MTLSDWLFFGVIALLAINHVAVLPAGWRHRRWIFWPVQLLNLGAATLLMAVGIPDLEAIAPFLNWVLGLLLIFHIVGNNNKLTRSRRQVGGAESEELEAKRQRVRDALEAGRQGQHPPD
jgi:hypothetical protein